MKKLKLQYLKFVKKFRNIDYMSIGETIKDIGLGLMVNAIYAIYHNSLTLTEIFVTINASVIMYFGIKIKNIKRR